jgi:photosystem II stability/assembly factor-like uncharacterized protein
MTVRSLKFAAPLCALILLGQGCGSATPATGPDGGIYRSRTGGADWSQLKVFNQDTKLGSIASVVTVSFATDPQDPLALYLGTNEDGLLYSLNGGDSWQKVKDKNLTSGRVQGVAVSAKDKCTVYAAAGNKLYKTTNCLRDWTLINSDARPNLEITAVRTDWFNPDVLYIGTSQGDVYRSDNGGQSWLPLQLPQENGMRVNDLAIDPRDSRLIYVATDGSGLYKTQDRGTTFEKIYTQLSDFDGGRRPSRVVIDPTLPNIVYLITKQGLIRTEDGAANWKSLTLPTPASSVVIKALAIDPKDSKKITYATDTAIVFSLDGGLTWTSKKLPTKRTVAFLTYDLMPQQGLILGVGVPPKQ